MAVRSVAGLVVTMLAGCRMVLGLDVPQLAPPVDATDAAAVIEDASVDTSDSSCFPLREIDLCSVTASAPWVVTSAIVVDTTSSALCQSASVGGTELCVIYASSIRIDLRGVVRAIGARPLVLASDGAIEILGSVDVSSTATVSGAGANETGASPARPGPAIRLAAGHAI